MSVWSEVLRLLQLIDSNNYVELDNSNNYIVWNVSSRIKTCSVNQLFDYTIVLVRWAHGFGKS